MNSHHYEKNLRKVANQAVIYQILSVLILVGFTTLDFTFEMPFLSVIGFGVVSIYSLYILKILIFDDHPCPQCHLSFFKKRDSFSNLGFSIYTKKCTNCKFNF